MPRGRPSMFTDEQKLDIIWYIASRLVEGEFLVHVCRDMGLSHWTIRGWRKKHREWNDILDDAWDMGVDAIVDEVLRIVDTVELVETVTEETDEHGNLVKRTVRTEDNVARSKLKAWCRFQHLSRINARYGNRTQYMREEHNPVAHRADMQLMTDDELMAIACLDANRQPARISHQDSRLGEHNDEPSDGP